MVIDLNRVQGVCGGKVKEAGIGRRRLKGRLVWKLWKLEEIASCLMSSGIWKGHSDDEDGCERCEGEGGRV